MDSTPLSIHIHGSNASIPLFESQHFKGKHDSSWILNTGGSIWGLDYCPLNSKIDPKRQFLACGGYKEFVECKLVNKLKQLN